LSTLGRVKLKSLNPAQVRALYRAGPEWGWSPQTEKKEISPLTPDQARTLLEAARGDRFEALFVLAVHCGLKEGELLGLRWDSVDLEAGTLRVRRTLSRSICSAIAFPRL
jgi:integrase